MAQLPRDSYTSYSSVAAEGFDAPPRAPRRGAADARRDDDDVESIEGYAPPRTSRWRMLRGPLLLAPICLGLIAVTWLAWTPVLDAVAEGATTLAGREGDGQTQVTATVAFGAAAVLGFVVAWWRGTHPRRAVRLSDDRGTMAVDAIAGQLRASFLEIDEVRDAEVRVENRGRRGGRSRVRVHTRIQVSAEARIDDVLDEVDDATEWLVRHRLGLRLSEPPLADVKYDELDLRTTRPHVERHRTGRAMQPDDEDA